MQSQALDLHLTARPLIECQHIFLLFLLVCQMSYALASFLVWVFYFISSTCNIASATMTLHQYPEAGLLCSSFSPQIKHFAIQSRQEQSLKSFPSHHRSSDSCLPALLPVYEPCFLFIYRIPTGSLSKDGCQVSLYWIHGGVLAWRPTWG